MSPTKEKAHVLIEAVRSALKNGVRHYDSKGRILKTEKEVLECLSKEGSVEIEPPRADE